MLEILDGTQVDICFQERLANEVIQPDVVAFGKYFFCQLKYLTMEKNLICGFPHSADHFSSEVENPVEH